MSRIELKWNSPQGSMSDRKELQLERLSQHSKQRLEITYCWVKRVIKSYSLDQQSKDASKRWSFS